MDVSAEVGILGQIVRETEQRLWSSVMTGCNLVKACKEFSVVGP